MIGFDFGRDLNDAQKTGLVTSNCSGAMCTAGLTEAPLLFILVLTKNQH